MLQVLLGAGFLIPGAGQYYNGQWEKGVAFMAVQVVTASGAINRSNGTALEVGPQPHSLGISLARVRFQKKRRHCT